MSGLRVAGGKCGSQSDDGTEKPTSFFHFRESEVVGNVRSAVAEIVIFQTAPIAEPFGIRYVVKHLFHLLVLIDFLGAIESRLLRKCFLAGCHVTGLGLDTGFGNLCLLGFRLCQQMLLHGF